MPLKRLIYVESGYAITFVIYYLFGMSSVDRVDLLIGPDIGKGPPIPLSKLVLRIVKPQKALSPPSIYLLLEILLSSKLHA